MIFTTKLIPAPFAAVTVWPFIFVRPESRNDAGLIAHEMVHYREQAWVTPWWLARYFLSKSFRQAAEVRAYRVQIAAGGITRERAAWYLAMYGLRLTYVQALELLRKQ